MRKLAAAGAILCFAVLAGIVRGQGSAPSTLSSRPPSRPSEKASPASVPKENPPAEKNPAAKPKDAASPAVAQEQIITEIYADQTVFDSTKSIGIFTGHVVVTDPRFQIQGDKLTIFISKNKTRASKKRSSKVTWA
jgi:hypothetical protein